MKKIIKIGIQYLLFESNECHKIREDEYPGNECHNDRTDILSDSETVGAYPSDYDDYDEQGCHYY